jgi:REP element-mobilizing transposase RayT
MKQIKFEFFKDYKMNFGGEDLFGKRKSQRPLSIKSPLHLVLKSEMPKIFDPGSRRLQKLIQDIAMKFNVKIFDFAINWSHIHFLIQVKDRKDDVRFIRALTSKLAMAVKTKYPESKTKLFTLRPYTRIVSWGKDKFVSPCPPL